MANIFYYFFSYFVVSLGLALIFVPVIRPLAFKWGAVDRGTGRRVHSGVIPRLGGLGIFLAFIIPMVFKLTRGSWDVFHQNMVGILVASAVVVFLGAYDDIKGAKVSHKLAAEIIAAAVIYWWGIRITLITNPFGQPFELGWMSLPVTVLWIIVITNAVNLIDGLDGLAAGSGILISATFFLLDSSYLNLQIIYVILAGSLAGFLRYNFPPASIFMGDSGSLFLGFFLASTSILSSHKATALATMMVPIIAFIFPLMDMTYAVLRRYYRGIALGSADREHIHHKLLDKGFTKKKALFILYAVNISVMLLILLVVKKQLNADFLGLVLIVVVAIAGLRLFDYLEFLPLIKDQLRKHGIGKRRRYYDYVVSRFRKSAAKSRSFSDFEEHLTLLLQEYNFYSVKILLNNPSAGHVFYIYNDGTAAGNSINLSFPIICSEECLGEIQVSKLMDKNRMMCTSDLILALSEEVGGFIRRTGDANKSRPAPE